MNRRFLLFVASGLFLAALILNGGWVYWQAQPVVEAWGCLDPAEKRISEVSSGQHVQAVFRLKNASSQPYRILGGSVC